MNTIICCRCQLPSSKPLSVTLPAGEEAYCIPCITALSRNDTLNPDSAEDRIELLAGRACAFCYSKLPQVEQSFEGTGMVRVCSECVSGLREAIEIETV